MDNFWTSRKVVWVFLGIGLLCILLVVFAAISTVKSPVSDNVSPGQNKSQVVKKNVDPAQLPEKFPADFPQEAGAVITANNVQTTADGKFQSTRSYITAKSLQDNSKLFQTYFQKSGWKITATVDQQNYKAISASKDDLNIQVSLNDNQVTKQKTVDVYLVKNLVTK